MAANAMNVELHIVSAGTPQEVVEAFADLSNRRITALGVMADAFLDSQRERIVALSTLNGIAGCYPWRDYVLVGGLMSYGTNLSDSYRQAGIYMGRMISG